MNTNARAFGVGGVPYFLQKIVALPQFTVDLHTREHAVEKKQ